MRGLSVWYLLAVASAASASEVSCLRGVYQANEARTAAYLGGLVQGGVYLPGVYEQLRSTWQQYGLTIHWWRCDRLAFGFSKVPMPEGAKASELSYNLVAPVAHDAEVYSYRLEEVGEVQAIHFEGECYYVPMQAGVREYFCPLDALPDTWSVEIDDED
ncbi:MAG: hypothetical protein AAGA68_23940 [Pseudomonadota bacterium]